MFTFFAFLTSRACQCYQRTKRWI